MTQPGSGTGFQTFVNNLPPPGVAGDFAGANIRANVVASLNGLVATPAGVGIGLGAFADTGNGLASNYYRPSSFMGFVHRDMQGIFTNYLGISGATIQKGDPVTVMQTGDFWGFFSASAAVGQKVYFDPLLGVLTAGSTGAGVTLTGGTGTISASVLTVVAAPSPANLAVGQVIVMAGVANGTYIASLGTGSGGTGTYNLANADGSAIANVGSTTAFTAYGVQESQFYVMSPVTADASITATLAAPVAPSTFGILTVSAIGSGVLAAGQYLSSTGATPVPATANLQILEQLTGTAGSTGTYLTNNVSYVVSSGETFAATQGKLGKISSQAGLQL